MSYLSLVSGIVFYESPQADLLLRFLSRLSPLITGFFFNFIVMIGIPVIVLKPRRLKQSRSDILCFVRSEKSGAPM